MRSRSATWAILGAGLVAWMVIVARAASPSSAYLPAVQSAPVATTCDGKAPLLDQDTGDLDVVLDTFGRFLVAYQDRAHGSRIKVDQHIGAGLTPLPALVALSIVAAPSFSPDGPKQGSVALVALPGGRTRMYYTQRKLDDTPNEGPYGIWCLEF